MTRPAGNDDADGIASSRKGALPPGLRQLAALLADGLGEFANATLSLDAAGAARLAALEGCSLLVTTAAPVSASQPASPPGPMELSFSLLVTAGRLRLLAEPVPAPNAIVSGPLRDLAAWALSRGRQHPAGLRIDGDTRLLETLAEIGEGYSPDLERPLGRLLGPANATRLLAAAEVAFAGARSLLQGATAGARQGAAQWFATDQALAGFLDELDDLKLSVDRLAARVLNAEARAAANPTAVVATAEARAAEQRAAEQQHMP